MTENNVTVERIENVVEINNLGIQGPRGKGVLHGSGVPTNSLGTDGEFYIDTSVNRMYGPKTNGQWTTSVNLGGTYTHVQDVPSSNWVINHNLEYFPSVEIVNSAGTAVIGDYQYVNANTVIANFTNPFAGKAYLS
jgi:hypothetical protein